MTVKRELPGHLTGLDFLKTLAIVGVTLFHLCPDFLPGGYLGVSCFFVLTGYLLAYNSLKSYKAGKFSVLGYYVKRLQRLYPPLVIMLLTAIGVFYWTVPETVAAIRPEALSVLLGYNNWWQLAQNADYFSKIVSPFTHLWFLGVEMEFYFLWPFVLGFYLLLRRGHRLLALTVFLLLAVLTALLLPLMYSQGTDITRLYYGTDTRVHALLMGALLGFYQAEARAVTRGPSIGTALAMTIFILGIVASYVLLPGDASMVYRGGLPAFALLFCLLLLAMTRWGVGTVTFLENPALTWAGRHSYGLFLWQYPVLFLFEHYGLTDPTAKLAAIFLIIVLTAWSDALSAWLISPHNPSGRGAKLLCKVVAIFCITLSASILMGFGCYGLVASASERSNLQTELKERLARETDLLRENFTPATPPPAAAKEAVGATVDLSGVTFVGDSVMLGAAGALRELFPRAVIDAEISRYVNGGADAMEAIMAQGKVGDTAVIHLGTNGPIAGGERYEQHTRRLLNLLGARRHIFWINTYAPHLKWQDSNNEYLKKAAQSHPNLTIIDWHTAAKEHPEWLSEDGIHPTEAGSLAYAKLVKERVAQVLSAEKEVGP